MRTATTSPDTDSGPASDESVKPPAAEEPGRVAVRAARSPVTLGLAGVALLTGMIALRGCATSVQPVEPEPPITDPTASEPELAATETEPEPEPDPGPWRPPPEPELDGLKGAAQQLSHEHASRSLELLEEVTPEPGEGAWFQRGAIAGRAHFELGSYAEAVAALEPIAAHEDLEDHLPPEVIMFELARARIALAEHGGLEAERVHAEREAAATLLDRATREKPNRQVAPMRVAYALNLAAMDHEGDARKSTARKSVKNLERLIRDYPNHPEVGRFQLEHARALLRAGKTTDGIAALRRVVIERAGEPESTEAWAELVRLAEGDEKIELRPLSVAEQLEQAQHARTLRRLETSRAILDGLLADPELSKTDRYLALHSRAWTAYKQREFNRCADDLEPLWERTHSLAIREERVRCLERGERYDELLDLWMDIADDKKARVGIRAAALSHAIDIGIKAGRYEDALAWTRRYRKSFKGRVTDMRWNEAWLAYRTGDHEAALPLLEEVEAKNSSRRTLARYVQGKILVRQQNDSARARGGELLRSVVDEGPLTYYGLQARQRLLDAGFEAPTLPALDPFEEEARVYAWADTRGLFEPLVDEFGQDLDALRRADQLHRIGYLEEARRELRVAADQYINYRMSPSLPRSESLEVGLAWKPEWTYPRPSLGSKTRTQVRDEAARERLSNGLRQLTHALQEPYRFCKLTTPEMGAYQARWQPRAYRQTLERWAHERELDPYILWSLMYTESRFRRFVVSPVNARGALQVMPWTGRQLAERLGELPPGAHYDPHEMFEIEENARLSSYYVQELLTNFKGQAPMVYAGYNGGPSNVARWAKAKGTYPGGIEMDDFIEEIPFTESYRYTKRVMEVRAVYYLLYQGELPRWDNTVDPDVGGVIEF